MAIKYSDQELKSIQLKLIEEQKKMQKRIKDLQKEDPFLDPDHVTDNAAIDTDVREQIGHDTIEATIGELSKKLLLIESALKRTYNKTYGMCGHCGKQIAENRLALVPEAQNCMVCHKKLFVE